MEAFIIISIALVFSLLLADFFHYLKSSKVIGLMLAGIIFSFPLFKSYATRDIVTIIGFMSNLGIVFLLFVTGLEIDSKKLRRCEKDAFKISFFSAFLPLFLGFFLGKIIGLSNISSFAIGAALSISSEGAVAMVLMELGKIKSKLGTIMLGAGLIDDLIGISLLSILLIIIDGQGLIGFLMFLLKIMIFSLLVLILFKSLLPRFLKHSLNKKTIIHHSGNTMSLVLIIGFVIAALASSLGLGQVLGAFIAGFLIKRVLKDKKAIEELTHEIKEFSFALIIPFFFIFIGLNFDYTAILNNIFLLLAILLIAIFGKMVGTGLAGKYTKLNVHQLGIIGWGLNSRGALELVIAEIARSAGLISTEIYSILVTVAIITTIIFPFAIRYYTNKWPRILD